MIEGTWKPVEAELAGLELHVGALGRMILTIKGDHYFLSIPDEELDQGTIKLDPAKKPKTMDIFGTEGPNKGRTFPAIYELAGDTLRICYNLEGRTRPAQFKTGADAKFFLVTYQRQKS